MFKRFQIACDSATKWVLNEIQFGLVCGESSTGGRTKVRGWACVGTDKEHPALALGCSFKWHRESWQWWWCNDGDNADASNDGDGGNGDDNGDGEADNGDDDEDNDDSNDGDDDDGDVDHDRDDERMVNGT